MPINKQVKPGDIIAVPLDEENIAVGLILHVSSRFKNGVLVAFYDHLFPGPDAVVLDVPPPDFVDVPNYTGMQLVKNGRWQVIDHRPDLLEIAEVPLLRVATHVYHKDTVVKHFPLEQMDLAKQYPLLEGQGGKFIEKKLRRHFSVKSSE